MVSVKIAFEVVSEFVISVEIASVVVSEFAVAIDVAVGTKFVIAVDSKE